MFFSCVEPSEFSIFMFFMFSCENHLSKKNKNIFPIFTPFDTRKIKFHVWNREKKIILMWNLFYFHMQKKDFTCENVFSWLDTWKHSSPHQIVYTWKKYWELGEKMPLVVKMRITEWNTFFFFTPLTQHIFSLDTWKYFFHVWNRVNFFFHSGKLIFRAKKRNTRNKCLPCRPFRASVLYLCHNIKIQNQTLQHLSTGLQPK